MNIVASPDPVALTTTFAAAMGHADACPCGNNQPPDAAIPRGPSRWLTHYTCADCQRTWTLDWNAA